MTRPARLDIDFSIVIPSRQRINKLVNCLHSFFSKAANPDRVEVVLVFDHDDTSCRNFSDFIIARDWNVRSVHVYRSEMMIRDYNNYGCRCATGRYMWISNDDYEMVTQDWDNILKEKIESFCQSTGDRIAYVSIDDSTHGPDAWNTIHQNGCCCPILTREAVDAMGGIMPGEINSWGADIHLFHIFKRLPQNRVIDAINQVKVLHHCRHNNTAPVDEVSSRIEKISRVGAITQEEQDRYVASLVKEMKL